jgi:hypothetical protein
MITMTTESSLQEQFLNDFTEKVLWRGRSDNQPWCCWFRFHPKNYRHSNTDVAKQIKEQLNGSFNPKNMPATLATVVKKIIEKFGNQMAADGVNLEDLQRTRGWHPQNPGELYPWQIIYQWLWQVEFPRVGLELANKLANWARKEFKMIDIKDVPPDRDFDPEEILTCEDTIEKGKKYALAVNFQSEGYLLLLNRGVTGKHYCFSPSQAFQPQGVCVPDTPLYLPDFDAVAKSLKFMDVGEEYFLAILTEEPLNLSWVRPDGNPRDLQVDDRRFQEIFQELGRQWNARVFYKRFQVVDS